MNEEEQIQESSDVSKGAADKDLNATRREFLKKYGKLAAITPVAMTMTLHSKQALASDSGPSSFDWLDPDENTGGSI